MHFRVSWCGIGIAGFKVDYMDLSTFDVKFCEKLIGFLSWSIWFVRVVKNSGKVHIASIIRLFLTDFDF